MSSLPTAGPEPSNGPPPLDETRSLASRIAGMAKNIERLKREGQRGRLAELRRLRPEELPREIFWEMVVRHGIPPREEPFWLAVLPLMVRYPHQSGARPGEALEATQLSSARFERWLRLDRDDARREAARVLARLKDQGLDWVELGSVLYRWSDEDRYRTARSFFRARQRRESISNEGAK